MNTVNPTGVTFNPNLRLFLENPFKAFSTSNAEVSFKSAYDYIHKECNVLVVGAGGLGCEILKCLVLSGFTKISVVDRGLVALSNLNRQLFYREKDIGKHKAAVAVEFLSVRYAQRGVVGKAYTQDIETFPTTFFMQFDVVIGGLDNIEARRSLNAVLHSIVQFNATTGKPILSTLKPYFDGGTEGYRGQCRTILPFITSCYECSLGLFPQTTNAHYPLCTVTHHPYLPEHCIEYAYTVQWDAAFPEKKCDINNDSCVLWLYEQAKKRADSYSINGVTLALTLGVLKNIIPAVASTNAIIASSIVIEVLKVTTHFSEILNHYFMYMGDTSTYTFSFNYEADKMCIVCGRSVVFLNITWRTTILDLVHKLKQHSFLDMKSPCITTRNSMLFMRGSLVHTEGCHLTASTTWRELVNQGITDPNGPLYVTDHTYVSPVEVYLRCTE